MANNVSTYINFHELNDKARDALEELKTKLEENSENFGDFFLDTHLCENISKEEMDTRGWYMDNVGAKWCYVDDMDEESISTVSAWTCPQIGIENLLKLLEEHDSELIATVKYEDEVPNFFGVLVYRGSELYESFELEWNEIVENLNMKYPKELKENWNEDGEEWNEDGTDFFSDIIWEYVNTVQEEFLDEVLKKVLTF